MLIKIIEKQQSMSGLQNPDLNEHIYHQLSKKNSYGEQVAPIDPQVVNYEGRGSETLVRQFGSRHNSQTNIQSGSRIQSPTLPPNGNPTYLHPNSPTDYRSSGVRSPGLPPGLPQQRGSQVSRGSQREIEENARIQGASVHRGSSVGIAAGSGVRPPLSRNPSGQLPLGVHNNQVIRERNERFFSDHTLNKESKIEYVPFQKNIVEYEQRQTKKIVPKKRVVIEYEEKVHEEFVPRIETQPSYYAVEYRKQYVPEYIPEKTVKNIERRVPYKRIQYVPVTRQIVHYRGDNQQGIQMAGGCNQVFPMGAFSQGMPMIGGCNQGFPIMGGHFANQQNYPSFYQNYSGNFFNPAPQVHHGHIAGTAGAVIGAGNHIHGTQQYSQGIQELSKYSSRMCKGFKLKKNYDLYDHYETYIPSFKY